MAAPTNAIVSRVRLVSGLILFTFVSGHLLNHAAGLAGLGAMEASRLTFLYIWRGPLGSIALYCALAAHFTVAIFAIFHRRRMRAMSWPEAVQLAAGLAIIPLLAQHVVETRGAFELHGSSDSYAVMVWFFTQFRPRAGWFQTIALLVAWTHGCLGIWMWLRLKPWFGRLRWLAFALALLIPALSIGGFLAAAREVALLSRDRGWTDALIAGANFPDSTALLEAAEFWTLIAFWSILAATLLGRWLRDRIEPRFGAVKITYPGGREVVVPRGTSVLEASLAEGIPHAHVCGGRGRCSTCRVRIGVGLDDLPTPSNDESAVLKRTKSPPNVRLACQLRPTAALAVAPLLPPNAGPSDAWSKPGTLQGQEKELVVFFADLRGFTSLSEKRLPYDVVFILNRYFAAVGGAIEHAGGRIDKFIGDGIMALFGLDHGPRAGARDALAAARAIGDALAELNATLAHELDRPLELGIGLHLGPAIVGEMGHGRAVQLTAIGDTVNAASRIESATKEFKAQLLVGEAVAVAAGIDLSAFALEHVSLRGRDDSVPVRVVKRLEDLPLVAAFNAAPLTAAGRA